MQRPPALSCRAPELPVLPKLAFQMHLFLLRGELILLEI